MGIEWRDSLAIGVDEIDSHHKELLKRFNELLAACESGKAREELAGLLAFLDEYVVKHFSTEEKLQRKYGYPNHEKHRDEHEYFIRQLNAIKKEISIDGLELHHVMETNNMLLKWLVNHISKSDRALGAFLQSVV